MQIHLAKNRRHNCSQRVTSPSSQKAMAANLTAEMEFLPADKAAAVLPLALPQSVGKLGLDAYSAALELWRTAQPKTPWDGVALAACTLVSAMLLTKPWNRPDPYLSVWFEKPQSKNGASSKTGPTETRDIAQRLEQLVRSRVPIPSAHSTRLSHLPSAHTVVGQTGRHLLGLAVRHGTGLRRPSGERAAQPLLLRGHVCRPVRL